MSPRMATRLAGRRAPRQAGHSTAVPIFIPCLWHDKAPVELLNKQFRSKADLKVLAALETPSLGAGDSLRTGDYANVPRSFVLNCVFRLPALFERNEHPGG